MGTIDPFEVAARIQPLDEQVMALAKERQLQLTKPTGSLGRLEEVAVRMAGMTRSVQPVIKRKAVVVMAADHGVAVEGVSAYPAEVTPQMVLNFLHGGAAINALARQADAEVVVVDIGVAAELSHPRLLSRKVAYGTANMLHGPAMTRDQALQALPIGIDVCEALLAQGIDLVAIGEMGIGNTTAASAVVSCLAAVPVQLVTGRSTGINDVQLAHKIAVIER